VSTFRTWAREIAHWLKSLLGYSDRPHHEIFAEEYHANAALYRIHDADIPGCVELWKIVRRKQGSDLIVVLLDIAQLKQELGVRNTGARSRTEHWQSKLSRQLATELKAQSSVEGSHLIVVCWMCDRAGVDKKGRRYRVPVAVLVGAWTCELQGIMGSLNGNRIAIAVVKGAAYKLFRAKNANPLIWERFVNQAPWLEWFDAYAKHYLGHDHVLQPLKRKPGHPTVDKPETL